MGLDVEQIQDSGTGIHRRALRDGAIWSVILGVPMYVKIYSLTFRPAEFAAMVAAGFLAGWLLWGYGFYWAWGEALDAFDGRRDRR